MRPPHFKNCSAGPGLRVFSSNNSVATICRTLKRTNKWPNNFRKNLFKNCGTRLRMFCHKRCISTLTSSVNYFALWSWKHFNGMLLCQDFVARKKKVWAACHCLKSVRKSDLRKDLKFASLPLLSCMGLKLGLWLNASLRWWTAATQGYWEWHCMSTSMRWGSPTQNSMGIYGKSALKWRRGGCNLVPRACVTLIQRSGQRTLWKNPKPEPENPGSGFIAPAWGFKTKWRLLIITTRSAGPI